MIRDGDAANLVVSVRAVSIRAVSIRAVSVSFGGAPSAIKRDQKTRFAEKA